MTQEKIKVAKCAHCDQLHPVTSLAPAFRYPEAVFKAIKEGATSCSLAELDDSKTAYSDGGSIIVLHEKGQRPRAFIRSYIPIPMIGSDDTYDIGCWAEFLAMDDFFSVAEAMYEAASADALPELPVWLANNIPTILPWTMFQTAILKTKAGHIPSLRIDIRHMPCELVKLQQEGIGIERIAKFAEVWDNALTSTSEVTVQ